MGKPISGIFFKVTPAQKALIKQRMAETGVRNLSAYIRKMCIDGYVINLDIKQLDEISRLLRITANNVNQIAKRANESGRIYGEDVAEVRVQLESITASFGEVLSELAKIK